MARRIALLALGTVGVLALVQGAHSLRMATPVSRALTSPQGVAAVLVIFLEAGVFEWVRRRQPNIRKMTQAAGLRQFLVRVLGWIAAIGLATALLMWAGLPIAFALNGLLALTGLLILTGALIAGLVFRVSRGRPTA